MSDTGPEPGVLVTVALFVRPPVDRYLPTIASIRAALPGVPVLIGCPDRALLDEISVLFDDPLIECVEAHTSGEVVNRVAAERGGHVLGIDDAVVLPEGFLERALPIVDGELRVVSVSFLSNAAGYLSFPNPSAPQHHQVGDHDQDTLTRRLREVAPEPALAPIPYATGAVVLFSEAGLLALGPLAGETGFRLDTLAAELSIRGLGRGMQSLVDTGSFYSRPSDLGVDVNSTFLDRAEISWIVSRHPFAAGLMDVAREPGVSPRAIAVAVSRTKALGLRVLIDGIAIGPKEMGTQVQTLSLIDALADHPDVASVAVGLNGPIPRYAKVILDHPKVDARTCVAGDYSAFGHVDVAHRPYQPDLGFDLGRFGRAADRVVVTMQDLIAYQVAPYHASDGDWRRVREGTRRALGGADGVVVISHDTRRQLELEAMPVEGERLFVVENGTDHLRGDEDDVMPRELVRRAFSAGDFLLVLGANYAHKNRDLAIRTTVELARRGRSLHLVVVGAQVPYGSVRSLEARALLGAERLFPAAERIMVLPDVASEERNWLLRHASLVLYPTSAEGFGLVPFEAAMFGTPTVSVPFGPVAEVAAGVPVWAENWSPEAFADACERLLDDRGLYDAQIEAMRRAGSNYTWTRTAQQLVEMYRAVLAKPQRSPQVS